MSAPTPVDAESVVVDELAILIANCPTTLTFLGVADAAAAYAAISQYELNPSAAGDQYILVSDTEEIDFILESGDWPKGTLWLMLRKRVDPADAQDPIAARRAFTNLSGQILREAFALSQGGGYLFVKNFRRERKPGRGHLKAVNGKGDYMQAIYRAEFGLDS